MTLHQKLTPQWDWEWCLSTQMIVGTTLSVEFHQVEDPISHQHLVDSGTCALTRVTSAFMEIISLRFGTITWFPSSTTHHDS